MVHFAQYNSCPGNAQLNGCKSIDNLVYRMRVPRSCITEAFLLLIAWAFLAAGDDRARVQGRDAAVSSTWKCPGTSVEDVQGFPV